MGFLEKLQSFLEWLDSLRDRVLFVFIRPYWPRRILPNHLTYARMFISIFLFILLWYHDASRTIVISLFLIGAATDMLDGSVARGLGETTEFGAMIDPIADRMLIIPIAVYSLFYSHPWLFSTIIALEMINAAISTYAKRRNFPFASNIFGKIKMVLQSVVFAAILILWPHPPNMFFTELLWVSVAFIVTSIYLKVGEIRRQISYAK